MSNQQCQVNLRYNWTSDGTFICPCYIVIAFCYLESDWNRDSLWWCKKSSQGIALRAVNKNLAVTKHSSAEPLCHIEVPLRAESQTKWKYLQQSAIVEQLAAGWCRLKYLDNNKYVDGGGFWCNTAIEIGVLYTLLLTSQATIDLHLFIVCMDVFGRGCGTISSGQETRYLALQPKCWCWCELWPLSCDYLTGHVEHPFQVAS